MGKTLFSVCGHLITHAGQRQMLRGASVLVEGDHIVAVGSVAEIEALLDKEEPVDRIDCRDKIVLPGLVNGHNHSPWSVANLVYSATQSMGAAMQPDLIQGIEDYVIAPMAWFDDANTYDLAMCGLLDQILHGTTTTADANNQPDALYRAACDSGIRYVLQPQMVTSINWDLDEAGYLAEAERCIRDYHVGGNDRVTVAVHPSWPWNCTESLLTASMDLAKRNDVQFATHLFELAAEKERANALWADRGGAIAYLGEIGLLDPRTIFFHGIELDRAEMGLLADAGCALVHNPELNAELFARVADVPAWLEAGIKTSIGTDYGQFDMFTAMKLASMLPRIAHGSAINDWAMLEIATIGGAAAMRLDDKIGSIEPGKCADVITIDLSRNAGLIPFCDDPDWIVSLLVKQSTRTEVTDSMINGELVRRDGRFTRLDVEEIVGRARQWSTKFVADYRQMLRDGKPWHRTIHPMFMRPSLSGEAR